MIRANAQTRRKGDRIWESLRVEFQPLFDGRDIHISHLTSFDTRAFRRSTAALSLILVTAHFFSPRPAFPDASLILGRVIAEQSDFLRNLIDLAAHILCDLSRVR